jgi:hypothetical protein
MNRSDPMLTWKQRALLFKDLAPARGLGSRAFPWNKLQRMHESDLKPQYEKSSDEREGKGADNGEGRAEEEEGRGLGDQAHESQKTEGYFDIMDKMAGE